MQAADGPLRDVRVVDMASVIAGPGTARYFADFGAQVVKVERPGGDSTRSMGWTEPEESRSLYWKLVNRGKRSVVLDLKHEPDRDVLLALAAEAHLLVENMRPGKLEALGLGPEELWAVNPALVILRVSGFGQDGPYAKRPAFATIVEAMSGYAQLTGEPDGAPLLPPVALADEVTAIVGAFASMLALRHAERTGTGQVVDVSLLESMMSLMGPLPAVWAQLGERQPRLGSGIPFAIPRGTYQCSDGKWVALSAAAESVAQRVLRLIGHSGDARFSDFQARFRNRAELEKLVADWIAQRPADQVVDEFTRADAAITTVYDMAELSRDPQVAARRSLAEIDGVTMQAPIARLSKTPGRIRAVGPYLDAHRTQILAELGRDDGLTGTEAT